MVFSARARGRAGASTRAAYLQAPYRVELRTLRLPDPGPRDLVLRVEACGVCGTDVHTAAVRGTSPGPFGHEVAGTVETAGADVTGLAPGDRVALASSSFCGLCRLCRNGRSDLCARGPRFGRGGAMGFSDRILAPIEVAVPAGNLEPELACLAEPLGVAIDLVRTAGVSPGDRVLLVGPGPIGLMAMRLALAAGAASVVVAGRRTTGARAALATAWGARAVLEAGGAELAETARSQDGFDRVLVTAPPRVVGELVPLAAVGGVISYIGIDDAEGAAITIDADSFHFKKLQLRASHASPALWLPRAIDILAGDRDGWRRLVTARFPLERVEEAVRRAGGLDGADEVKVLVGPGVARP